MTDVKIDIKIENSVQQSNTFEVFELDSSENKQKFLDQVFHLLDDQKPSLIPITKLSCTNDNSNSVKTCVSPNSMFGFQAAYTKNIYSGKETLNAVDQYNLDIAQGISDACKKATFCLNPIKKFGYDQVVDKADYLASAKSNTTFDPSGRRAIPRATTIPGFYVLLLYFAVFKTMDQNLEDNIVITGSTGNKWSGQRILKQAIRKAGLQPRKKFAFKFLILFAMQGCLEQWYRAKTVTQGIYNQYKKLLCDCYKGTKQDYESKKKVFLE